MQSLHSSRFEILFVQLKGRGITDEVGAFTIDDHMILSAVARVNRPFPNYL